MEDNEDYSDILDKRIQELDETIVKLESAPKDKLTASDLRLIERSRKMIDEYRNG